MNRIKVTDNFFLDELVPPEIYTARRGKAIELLDMRIVSALQFLREKAEEKYGSDVSFVVNNWATGGNFHESGRRLANTRTGAKWSQHKDGRALDPKPKGLTVSQLFDIAKEHERFLVDNALLTTIENISFTKTWLHIDCRYTGLDQFLIVNP